MDFYARVPKDLKENLRYRLALRKRAEKDPVFQQAMIQACREDVLFFLSAWAWLHEPRPMRDENGRLLPEIVPFIPWPHQEPVILKARAKLGFDDIGVEKSRAQGMSWIAVYMAVHDWVFAKPGVRMVSIAMVSRTLEFADTPGNMNSLGAKIDWALERLPVWMVGKKATDWKRNVANHTWQNLRNGALIAAYGTTGEMGSGGRFTYFILDELSKFPSGADEEALTSTQQTTKSRLIISTPYGSKGAYYDVMHQLSSMEKLVLAWEDNPTQNRGLYQIVGGRPVAVNPASNPLPKHYAPPSREIEELFARLRRKGFRLEKGLRSPWYDQECDRANATPFSIAQELDRDYGGSAYRVFQDDFITAAHAKVRHPFCNVTVDYDEALTPTITRALDGPLHLWMTLDAKNRPPDHPYVVGVDLSQGLAGDYSSNSVLEIIDALTMCQVGELTSNTIEPGDFADLTVAVCKWLGSAYLAWERNGPGAGFTTQIRKTGYANVYYNTRIFDRKHRKTRVPGWWTDEKTKEAMFTEVRRIIVSEELTIYSEALAKEFRMYVRVGRKIEYEGSSRAEGPDSGAGHGDRVMAMGVAIQALRDRPVAPPTVEPGSLEEHLSRYTPREPTFDDWDSRTTWDLMGGPAQRRST